MFGNITSANIATVRNDVNSEDKHFIQYAVKESLDINTQRWKCIEIGDKMEDKDIESYAETNVVPEPLHFFRYIIDPNAAEDISMQFSSVEIKRGC